MKIAPDTQAVLLLTASFRTGPGPDAVRPLTIAEWARFAPWLVERGRRPGDLLAGDPDRILADWRDESLPRERLEALLNRGAALALALEKWLGAGLWVLTRGDEDYPTRLKQRLGRSSPPVLFGCGDPALLNTGGLAVTGSRNAGPEELARSLSIGRLAAGQGLTVVSGGARGVDETAMSGALHIEGTVVGVLADSLLRRTAEARYRPHLMSGDLTLVSPFHPEAESRADHAMGRNRCVYCLSDAAVVVCSGPEGGTWSGATENLRRGWVPLWVRRDPSAASGTAGLIAQGAGRLPDDVEGVDFTALIRGRAEAEHPPADLPPDSAGTAGEEPVRYPAPEKDPGQMDLFGEAFRERGGDS